MARSSDLSIELEADFSAEEWDEIEAAREEEEYAIYVEKMRCLKTNRLF